MNKTNMTVHKVKIVAETTNHLFEEQGKLSEVFDFAITWYKALRSIKEYH
jgi:hypothetical protein